MPTRIPRPLTVGAVLFVVAASTPAAQTSTWVFQAPTAGCSTRRTAKATE